MSYQKWCPDCREYIDEGEFNKNNSKKDGLGSYCKKHDYLRKKKSLFNKIFNKKKNIVGI